jgi:hypothetical protein
MNGCRIHRNKEIGLAAEHILRMVHMYRCPNVYAEDGEWQSAERSPGGRWLRITCRKCKVTAVWRFSHAFRDKKLGVIVSAHNRIAT